MMTASVRGRLCNAGHYIYAKMVANEISHVTMRTAFLQIIIITAAACRRKLNTVVEFRM